MGSEPSTHQRPNGTVFDDQDEVLPHNSWDLTQGLLHQSPSQSARPHHNLPRPSKEHGSTHPQLDNDSQWNRPPNTIFTSSALMASGFGDKRSRQTISFTSNEPDQHYSHQTTDELSKDSAQDTKYGLFGGGEDFGDVDEDPLDEDGEIFLHDAVHEGADSESHYSVNLNDAQAVKKLMEVLQERGYLGPQGSDKAPSVIDEVTKSESTAASSSKSLFGCRLCKKSFHRRCELR